MEVATEMAYPPSTNSITRSATYSEVTAPGPIRSIFSEVAKTVSTKKFTCEIPMPKNPGTISRATALTPGCVKERPKLKRIPCRTSRGSCTRNCSAPLPLLLAEHREHVNHARRKHHAQHREHG